MAGYQRRDEHTELADLSVYQASNPRSGEPQFGGGNPAFWQDGRTPSLGNPAGDGDNKNRALADAGKVTIEGMAVQSDFISIVLKLKRAAKELVEIVKDMPREWGKDVAWDGRQDVVPWTRQERGMRWTRL